MSNLKGTIKTALFLASKDLTKDKTIALMVVFVVAFGFLFFGISTALGDGFENAVQNELITTLTSHISIEPTKDSNVFDDVSNIERKLDLIPGIAGISPRLKYTGCVSYKDKSLDTAILALTPSKESKVTEIPEKIKFGEFLEDDDTDEIVLGMQLTNVQTEGGWQLTTLKNNLDVEIGDKVSVIYTNGVTRQYNVKGILEGGNLGADWYAYVTNKEMESVLGKDKASVVLVRLQDPDSVDEYKSLILQQGIHGNVKSWKDDTGFIEGITSSLSMFTQIITGIGLMTAIITIAIVVYINSSRKKRLTGVLKAIGAQNNVVFAVFIIEALIFGFFGILAGIGMSYAADLFITAHPMHMPIGDVYLSFEPSLFLKAGLYIMTASILAGFYPAWKTANQDIIKSMWNK